MPKKIIFLIFAIYSQILSAIDSGTISATLYFRLTEETPNQEAINTLFDKLLAALYQENAAPEIIERVSREIARYESGKNVNEEIQHIWKQLTDNDDESTDYTFQFIPQFLAYNNVKENPLIDYKHYKTIKPWILPESHPMKPYLDRIFKASRAIRDQHSFDQAGFITFAVQPRSYIRVARHPDLPGYVVKVYLDTLLKKKKNVPGWKWFARRCEGADKIKRIILKKEITLFKVPNKWIYPLPTTPKPPKGPEYDPKAEILIAEDMNIISNKESLIAWKTLMTKEHLNQLYTIIAYAGGDSYRPDNIPWSRDGKFAFVDTEYPNQRPNFDKTKRFLTPELAEYWQFLVDQGGP